ncbi:MAG TPA: tetratricopeptide repeat protein [Gammaproteobacteria bacterium]|nr:tetratricopeptide repeat protein [Gammaproteobacteria bacterium]
MSGATWLTVAVIAAIWPFGRNKEPEETGTIRDLEDIVVEIEPGAPIESSDAKAMESYRLFLDLASADPLLQAEATRRLADLQLESEEAAELARNVESLGDALGGTIDLYEGLLESYPDYEKSDLVLYQLSRAYEAGGEIEAALEILDRLIEEHPDTEHWVEAQFRRGEMLFVEQRYEEAAAAYSSVIERGESPYYEQSLYKLGWSRFKQLRYDASLEPFFALLDRTLPGEEPAEIYAAMGRAEQELMDDTLRVIAISFSYLDGPDSIADIFEDLGSRGYTYIVYTGLGDLYLDQERYQDAADAYAAFVDADPTHTHAPLVQVEVIEAYKQGGFTGLVLDAKRDFVERYAAGMPYWRTRRFEEQPEITAHLKANLTDLAAYHHAEAQESRDAEQYGEAARWYRIYLDSFPDDEGAAGTNFLLAEVLFESGDFAAAAAEYEGTAYGYAFHEESAEAGYAALIAYAERQSELTGGEAASWHRQSIDSALRFSATYSEHEQAPAVRADAAEKLFTLDEFERARDVAAEALLVPTTPELERTAWTVYAHSQFDLEDYAAAESAYLNLEAYVPIDDPDRGEITERIASSIYRQGEQAQAAGLVDEAVDHFLRVGRTVPDSAIRATAEYDAAAALIQAGDWQRAAPVLEGFRAAFPAHELAADATASLAVAYVETGQNRRAAGEFEVIAESGATEEIRQEALWRAGELYQSGADTNAATAVLMRYVERYAEPFSQAIEARHQLVELAGASGDDRERLRWLESLVAADASAGTSRTDRSRYLAAHAQLTLAEPARQAFEVSRLVAPLEQSLRLKRERMEVALEAYRKAAEYGVAEVTTAATYQLAELYHGLSRALFESERPADLTQLELAQYDILLEEQAFPFEEEAIGLHEVNAARTADGVYDEWVAASLAGLAALMPGRYAKYEKGERLVSSIW